MQEIEFNKNLDEMNEPELRATFRDFRTTYTEAKEDYDELQNKVEQYKQEAEEAEDRAEVVDELHPKFSAMFAEMKDLDEEMVEDKFSTDELVEELEDADAFQLSLPVDEDENEEEEREFSDKEQKSKNVDDGSKYQDRIDEFMSGRVIER